MYIDCLALKLGYMKWKSSIINRIGYREGWVKGSVTLIRIRMVVDVSSTQLHGSRLHIIVHI